MKFTKTTEQNSDYHDLEKMEVSTLLQHINNEDKTKTKQILGENENGTLEHLLKVYKDKIEANQTNSTHTLETEILKVIQDLIKINYKIK